MRWDTRAPAQGPAPGPAPAPGDARGLAEATAGPPATFSVIVPVYQGAQRVAATLESILAQTRPAHEVLVCDDGSTDDLRGVLAPFTGRVLVLRQEHQGTAAARNLGLTRATGEFALVCDVDTTYLPDLLEAFGAFAAQRPDLDIISRTSYVRLDGGEPRLSRVPENPFVVDDQRLGIIRDNFVFRGSAFRRARLVELGGFRGDHPGVEDYDAWMRLILGGAVAGDVCTPLALTIGTSSGLNAQIESMRGRVALLGEVLARSDLSESERTMASSRREVYRRAAVLAEAKLAVERGDPGRRWLSAKVVAGAGYSLPTRAKALAVVISGRGAGGRRFPRGRPSSR